MPRQARLAPGDLFYHVLNRAAGKSTLFAQPSDFAAFIRTLHETQQRTPMRICVFCLMSNHWHLILWPENDGDLARFMQRLTITHVRRWLEHRQRVGTGPVYQGRYKSFPVQDDTHFTTLARYIERNPLRANLVERAEQWRWSSLGQSLHSSSKQIPHIPLTPWPVPRPRDWTDQVNTPQAQAEMLAVTHCIHHNRPFGAVAWTANMEKRLGLGPLRPRGRPSKKEN